MISTPVAKPAYVAAVEAVYGAPSQAGFGSAVFFERAPGRNLELVARANYKYFLGDNWERFGETVWMRQWKQVYARPVNAEHDIVGELRGITDSAAMVSVPMILENIANAVEARQALSTAFDHPAVAELEVFNIGDGEAMSGILIAGRRASGEMTCLVFLLD